MLGCVHLRIHAKRLSLSTRKLSVVRDITGNVVSSTIPGAIVHFDDAVIDMVSSNNDARPKLNQAISLDRRMYLAHTLKVFEALRYGTSHVHDMAIVNTLTKLDQICSEGSMTSRESWYAAGALAWAEGDYTLAGRLLESAALQNPGDLLATRLAQDAYLTCGSTENVLGCLIRHPSMGDTPQHLSGFLLSILAAGFAETGQLKRAEEEAERAVVSTKGDSAWAVYTLANSHQLTCQSSDMYGKLDEFEKKHENNGAMCYLHFNRGCAHIMRGNYSGAFKSLEELVALIDADVDGERVVVGPAWTNAVLLLWQLSLNTQDFGESAFDPMWKVLSLYAGSASTPLQYLCTSIVYSRASVAPPTRVIPSVQPATGGGTAAPASSEGSEDREESKEQGSKGWWDRLASAVGASNKPRRVSTGNVEQDSVEAHRESLRRMGQHIRGKYKEQLARQAEMGVDLRQALATHIASMVDDCAPVRVADFPALRAIQPVVSVVRGLQSGSNNSRADSALTDLQYCLREAVAPLSIALHAYNEQNYAEAARAFVELGPRIRLVGGTAAQRAIIEQMAMESFHRAGDLTSATLLLHERSVLVPHDAQCWRRLATIYGQMGQEGQAKQAHYTAWQLGIGQGGFGGPK